MTRVIVVGGGITGLCAAAGCAQAGCDVTLLERGSFGGEQPARAILAGDAAEHLQVWRMSGNAFHLDHEPHDVVADGAVVGQCRTVDPAGLLGAWAAECRRRGVQLYPGVPALGLLRFGGGVNGVESHLGTLAADEVVLAGGLATTRFLPGTPADVTLARRFRSYELRGPGQVSGPGVQQHGGVRLIPDAIGRVQAEAVEPAERPGAPLELPPDVAELPLLDAGDVLLTATPVGGPLLIRPTWLSGLNVLAGGVAAFDEAPRLGAMLAKGLTTGDWT
jgi:hypothetical protein